MTDLQRALDPAEWPEQVEFVRRLARSLVGSADADDVAQEAWLTWLRAPPRQVGALKSWLGTVVRNLVRMRGRESTRRVARESRVAGAGAGLEPSAAEVVAEIDLHRRVVEEVLALEEPYRSVIVLRFHEQRSLEQIARELDVPVETVKTRQKRGLVKLREALVGEDEAKGRAALVALAFGGGAAMSGGAKGALAVAAIAVAVIAGGAYVVTRDRASVAETAPQSSAQATTEPVADSAPAVVATERVPEETPIVPAPTSIPKPTKPIGGFLATLRGDVVDPAGRPLAGIAIEVFGRDGDARSVPSGSGQTDGAGRFELVDLPFKRRSSASVMASNGSTFVGTTVDPRSDASVHLVMPMSCSLVGRVTDMDDQPIEGATVFTRYLSVGSMDDRVGFLVPPALQARRVALSRVDGSFEIPALPRGWDVVIEATHDGFSSCRQSVGLSTTANEVATSIVLRPEGRIDGRVTGTDGTPMPGIRVGAQGLDHSVRNSWGEGTTDESGHFTIRGLERAKWNVFVRFDEEQQREWCALPAEAIELTDADPDAVVDLTLLRGGELEVRVVDMETREPIADQWIGIQSAAKPSSGAAIDVIYSGIDGVARGRLPPGGVRPYVSEDPTAVTWVDSKGARHRQPGIDEVLHEGRTLSLTVEIDRGATLRGIVLDPHGRPVDRAVVWFEGKAGPRRESVVATSAEDGMFALPRLPRAKQWALRASTTELGMLEALVVDPVTMDPSSLRLELVRRPATCLRGSLLDESGAPIAAATIKVMEIDGSGAPMNLNSPDPATRTRSDADGVFEIKGLWSERRLYFLASRLVEKGGRTVVEMAQFAVDALAVDEERDLGDIVLSEEQR